MDGRTVVREYLFFHNVASNSTSSLHLDLHALSVRIPHYPLYVFIYRWYESEDHPSLIPTHTLHL